MKYLINILILLFGLNLFSQQNLVPNGSFEEYFFCPYELEQIDSACKYWFTPWAILNPTRKGSSDYYNTCGSWPVSIPKNLAGKIYPKDGNAYTGIILISKSINIDFIGKEYLEIRINKLIKDKEYCIECYYSLGLYNDFIHNNYLNFEFFLSDTLISRTFTPNIFSMPNPIMVTPQVTSIIPTNIDTNIWYKASGSFIAKGNEQYLTIGNFQKLDSLDEAYIYLYIDDVKLYYCGPDTSIQPTKELEIPNIFTPNGDGFNDVFEYKNQEDWDIETQIFNRWGELLFSEKNINWDGKYKGKKVSEGVYFYKINAKALRGEEIKVFNGAVHVLYN